MRVPGTAVVDVFVHVTQGLSWVQIAAPVAAAVAAGASWRSAFIAKRSQVDADLPQLVFHLRTGDSAGPSLLVMKIENVGRGVAIVPGLVLLAGDGRGVSTLLNRNLSHGDVARVGIPFDTTPTALGLVFCEDRHNNVHVWSAEKKYRRYKKNRRRALTVRQMVSDLYNGFDVSDVAFVPTTRVPDSAAE